MKGQQVKGQQVTGQQVKGQQVKGLEEVQVKGLGVVEEALRHRHGEQRSREVESKGWHWNRRRIEGVWAEYTACCLPNLWVHHMFLYILLACSCHSISFCLIASTV